MQVRYLWGVCRLLSNTCPHIRSIGTLRTIAALSDANISPGQRNGRTEN